MFFLGHGVVTSWLSVAYLSEGVDKDDMCLCPAGDVEAVDKVMTCNSTLYQLHCVCVRRHHMFRQSYIKRHYTHKKLREVQCNEWPTLSDTTLYLSGIEQRYF